MEFSNTTTKDGIIQQIEKLTGLDDGVISGNSTLLKQFTGDVNNAYSRVANIILRADGRMQWDDPNHTNSPISDFDLVSGQKNYSVFDSLPSDLQNWLQIERVDILDTNDNGVHLVPIDHQSVEVAMSEFQKTNGTPNSFDFYGAELFLYPAPNYNKTSGGTIYFKRAPSYFVYTDTTKVPGFDILFHELLPLWASYWWGLPKGLGYVDNVRKEIVVLEEKLLISYPNRAKYEKKRITRLYKSYK